VSTPDFLAAREYYALLIDLVSEGRGQYRGGYLRKDQKCSLFDANMLLPLA
jgi:hypothetical protein